MEKEEIKIVCCRNCVHSVSYKISTPYAEEKIMCKYFGTTYPTFFCAYGKDKER